MAYRLKSDIVEKNFSQQRSQKHGANTNPTYLENSKGVNSVLLGRGSSKRSNKSNAATNHYTDESKKRKRPCTNLLTPMCLFSENVPSNHYHWQNISGR